MKDDTQAKVDAASAIGAAGSDALPCALAWAHRQAIGERHLDLCEQPLSDRGRERFDSVLVSRLRESPEKWIDAAAHCLVAGGQLVALMSLAETSGDAGQGLLVSIRLLHRSFEIDETTPLESFFGIVATRRETPLPGETEQLDLQVVEALEQALTSYSQQSAAEMQATQNLLNKQLREAQRELRKRTVQLLESAHTQADDEAEKQHLEQMVRAAETRADKMQQTLSFRLGYELIHRTKSLRGLASLPRALWDVNKEASRRRNGQSSFDVGRKRARRFVQNLQDSVGAKKKGPVEKHAPAAARRPTRHFEVPASLGQLATGEELAKLRVACIMDEFTLSSFGPECQALLLSPENWQQQLEEFQPQMLFVESAWRGKTDEWSGKIGHLSPELEGIVRWCRDRVPTVFWCKEDPVHFSTFINTAALFDFVFSTDIDCIHRYKELLGHDRIYLLPFACQPATQNPIEKYERAEAACFAGAYYTRYPERQRDFLRMVLKLLEHWPVEIFDRNYGKTDPAYQFPASYRPLIQGTLAFTEIDRAYKGYDYAININSIKYSQTMFARRVFEVLASNTVTVSNFSRGIQLMFGDLVISTDDANSLGSRLDELASSHTHHRKFRLLGLRKVLREHTYQDRLAYVVSKAFEIEAANLMPLVTAVGFAATALEIESIADAFSRQDYPHKRLLIIAPEALCRTKIAADSSVAKIVSLEARASEALTDLTSETDFIASFIADDYYGDSYLLDLALATRFFGGSAIGKTARYEWVAGEGPMLRGEGSQYRPTPSLAARSAIAAPSCFAGMKVAEYARCAPDLALKVAEAFATDEFSYCQGGAGHAGDSALAIVQTEIAGLDLGMPMARLLEEAESIQPPRPSVVVDGVIGPQRLSEIFAPGRKDHLSVEHSSEGMIIDSTLEHRMSEYIYARELSPMTEFGFSDLGRFYLDVTAGATVQTVFIFFDADEKRLFHTVDSSSTNHEITVPANACFLRFGLLVSGRGQVIVRRLVLGPLLDQEPVRIFGRSKRLVVTNQYPSSTDLYRNAFVHRRVVRYQEEGEKIDVFRLCPQEGLSYHDFEGVGVISGGEEILERLLATNEYESVLVHFLDQSMWSVLEKHLDGGQLIVWIHGFEIQSWERRRYNYTTEAEVNNAQKLSERRTRFWHTVLDKPHPNLKLVFVSQYLADEVQRDMDIALAPSQIEVIHNLIDTDLFAYEEKPIEQRTQVLSIRPYADRTYANDLSVQAIIELSEKPFFDDLDFRIIGDGLLFEETVAPLRGFGNVLIEKRFIAQDEIAALHREYGIFLVPSRMDSQGISRDEAMSSGLVPITTEVAAIPEFVDAECGFLARPEDASALAAAIEALYHDPALFQRLSANAAARVRRQSGPKQTIVRELALLTSPESGSAPT